MQCAPNIALLAPVPLEHLKTGRKTVEAHGKVAFGSGAFETFHKLEHLRDGMPVDVFIYASHNDGDPDIFWRARYIGYVKSDLGAHPSGMKYRPSSTSKYPRDNSGLWAVFWEVDGLKSVGRQEWCRLAEVKGFGKKKAYGHPFVPEGPLLIEHPS
jgi:hypothetical protein